MTAHRRQASLVDQIVSSLDKGLRSSFSRPKANRASPAEDFKDDPIADNELLKRRSASLMRVNHVGEVCAQALYQGQALTSRSDEVRKKMEEAANEEVDHLDWCYQRIKQLDSHTSYLNPIWYLGSWLIGVGAGIAGDKWSLGFLAETEKQVVDHLDSHLGRLPPEDVVSRSVVSQMAIDEAKHEAMAIENGAAELPLMIKKIMRASARVMTSVSEKI